MHRLICISLCLVFTTLFGCTAFYQPSEQEKRTVDELTTNMRTWALGRGLIDLPESWENKGADVKLYYGLTADHSTVEVRVLGEAVSQKRFDDALEERSARIAAKKNHEQLDVPMLVSAQPVTQQSRLLQYYKSEFQPENFTHELHILIDDVYVMLRADSYNGKIAPVEARLTKLATQIFKVNPLNAGSGFAMGPIVIRGDHDQEIATFYFGPPASDVSLEVYVNALSPSETDNMQAGIKADAGVFLAGDYENLRGRSITLADMRAEEALIAFSDDTHRQILFISENYRDTPSLSQPSMHLRMTAGGMKGTPSDPGKPKDLVRWSLPSFARKGYDLPLWQRPARQAPVNPSLTDYEAMAVWDAILKTVRIRFGAVPPPKPDPFYSVIVPSDEEIAEGKRVLDEFLATGPDGKPWKPEGW
ncbi:unnamed protein product, partial [Mesorhabditis spiculigera]